MGFRLRSRTEPGNQREAGSGLVCTSKRPNSPWSSNLRSPLLDRTVLKNGRSNSSSRTTPLTGSMTVTMVTNETGFNSTKLPEVVASGSGMGMVLVPFGIITIIGLAVVMQDHFDMKPEMCIK
ncbi:hypothetical protein GN956_G5206 [Arapaima gigas]